MQRHAIMLDIRIEARNHAVSRSRRKRAAKSPRC